MMEPNSPEPKAPPTLPPEILFMIIEHIPIDGEGRQTLVACALVATWWAGPSQRRLFSSVTVGYRNYQRWMNGVVLPGSKTHLLKYVRSLQRVSTLGFGIRDSMRNLPEDSGEYLSALSNVHTLELSEIKIEHISEGEFHRCFSAFRETLTHLALEFFRTSFSAFVTLVDYFPNLTTLRMGWFDIKPDEGSVPPLSRPLRGRMRLGCAVSRYAKFFDRFAELDPEYEELVLESEYRVETALVESFLRLCASTVKYLRLNARFSRERAYEDFAFVVHPNPNPYYVLVGAATTIRHFQQLRELEMIVEPTISCHEDLLPSITSTELRRIIILTRREYDCRVFSRRTGQWASVDKQLCEVVDRLRAMGHPHTLEVELHFTRVGGDPDENDFTKVLSGFREKGVVTIADDARGDLVYRSCTHSS